MKTQMIRMAVVSFIALIASGNAAGAKDSPCSGPWSSTVNGLRGRCVLSTNSIGKGADLTVYMELSNEGKGTLTLEPGNPFWERADLFGPDNRPVPPMTRVPGLLMSSDRASLPRDCYLGFPVSKRHLGGAGQVAVGMFAWRNLSPGKYKLRVKYAVVPKAEKESEKQAALKKGQWRGTLVLPAVEIEVVGE